MGYRDPADPQRYWNGKQWLRQVDGQFHFSVSDAGQTTRTRRAR
jgi:hypothetical protein